MIMFSYVDPIMPCLQGSGDNIFLETPDLPWKISGWPFKPTGEHTDSPTIGRAKIGHGHPIVQKNRSSLIQCLFRSSTLIVDFSHGEQV